MSVLRHHHVTLNGLRQHFVTGGDGPPVLLLHGFPDLWFGWRHVMEELIAVGYSVIAPDLRGFGETEAPRDAQCTTAFDVMGDLVAILDHLSLRQVAVVAHDWGAEVGWTIVRARPDRFGAIVALSVPFTPRGPASLPQLLEATAPPDLYMLYFLEEGRAEKELDADPSEFLARLFYTNSGDMPGDGAPSMRLGASGRLIDGLANPPDWWRSSHSEELEFYTAAFTRTGFRGALNTYRSLHRNWELLASWVDAPISVPTFYIGGSRDLVLQFPGMQDLVTAMPKIIAQCTPPVILDGVGHFIQAEKPGEVSKLIADFLYSHHPVHGIGES